MKKSVTSILPKNNNTKMATRRDREDDLIQKQNPLSKIPFIQKILFFSCKNATLMRLAQLMSVHSSWYETIRNPRFGTAGTIFCNNMSEKQKSTAREFIVRTHDHVNLVEQSDYDDLDDDVDYGGVQLFHERAVDKEIQREKVLQRKKLVLDFIQCGIVPGVIQYLDANLLIEDLRECYGSTDVDPEIVQLVVAYGARRPESFHQVPEIEVEREMSSSGSYRKTATNYATVAKLGELLQHFSEQTLIHVSVVWFRDKYNYFPPAATLEHKTKYLKRARQRIEDFELKIKALSEDIAEVENSTKNGY
jgi:hypothetical protein